MENQINDNTSIDSLDRTNGKNADQIAAWEKCHEQYVSERKKSSLANFKDSNVRDILRWYYSMEGDSIKRPKNITEYIANIESSSLLYFKIKINSNLVSDLELTLTGKPFKKEHHSITISDPDKCCLIDNKIYWGTDGRLPVEQVDRFEIKINGKRVFIPETAYNDLFEPLWCGGSEHKGKVIVSNDRLYIIFLLYGSDGAGSYTASFIFKNETYIGRIVEETC